MTGTTRSPGPVLPLTQVCRPVLEFMINFDRARSAGALGEYAEIRGQAGRAIAIAEDAAGKSDDATAAAWNEFARNMLVYFIDYKMINSEWHGAIEWKQSPFEAELLQHSDVLGGELFFSDAAQVMDRLQRSNQLAHRGDDRWEELLSLYYACIRLGFKGQYGPGMFGEAGDETGLQQRAKEMYMLLPAFKTSRELRLFPQAYEHRLERDFNPPIGTTLAVAGAIAAVVLLAAGLIFFFAWDHATSVIREAAERVRDGKYFEKG